MSGVKPAFVTGANAKVKIGGVTMAYAQDVSYNVSVATIPIETMGRYEVVTNEPIAYFVEGTLSIIRYTKQAVNAGITKGAATGNSVGNINLHGQQKADKQISPSNILTSKTFDLEIFQKFDDAGSTNTLVVAKVIDCRLTRLGSGITKRGVLTEGFAFVGRLYQDDAFTASDSGDTDLV